MARNSSYHHLDALERSSIADFRAAGETLAAIARALGRTVRTISAELKRNSHGGVYLACEAQPLVARRRRAARRKSVFGIRAAV